MPRAITCTNTRLVMKKHKKERKKERIMQANRPKRSIDAERLIMIDGE